MPMIDVFATDGTFADPRALAKELAGTLMRIEEVPALPMFRHNTAAFVHALPHGAIANVEGETCCSPRLPMEAGGSGDMPVPMPSSSRQRAEAAKLSGGAEK